MKDVCSISTYLLKQINGKIAEPFATIFNKCHQEGVFPSQLQVGRIVANCENYRPVSILPAASKIFEQAIVSRLIKYLESKKYFIISQHGYRKGRSTTSGVLRVVEDIYEAFDTSL